MLELRTLGALELTGTDRRSLGSVLTQPRRMALLCHLAIGSRRGFVRRDTLLAMFWPEQSAEQARHALRQSLYVLRRALGPDALVSRGDDELAVAPDRLRCDAVELDRAADEGRLSDALAMYQGEFLPGFFVPDAPEFERWLDSERARLRQRAADCAWRLAEASERAGDSAAAADLARRAAALSPADETVLRRLILLLDRLGDRAAAVRAYEAFARDLQREYELAPSDSTLALLSSIRARATTIDIPRRPPAEATSTNSPREGWQEIGVDATAGRPPARSAPTTPGRWRRRWQLGFAALLAIVGIAAWRIIARAHPASASSPRARVLVADFANRTSDSAFGELVSHILRRDLGRSHSLGVVGAETVDDALRRMGRPPGSPLGGQLAREVAAREQLNVVVEGEVRTVGSAFAISAAVIETATGDQLYGASEIARDSTDVLSAIKRLSDAVRQNVGESLNSIHASDSLFALTTPSLAALRMEMLATRAFLRGDYAAAVRLLDETIALDSSFAYAHLEQWAALDNGGLPNGRHVLPLIRAYQLRDRLTDWERFGVEGNYYLNVAGDLPRAIAAFRRHIDALDALPVRPAGWYANLATTLELTGDTLSARAILEEARSRHPTAVNQMVLAQLLYSLGNDRGAAEVLDDASRRYPVHPVVLAERVRLLADSGRYEEAHALAARMSNDAAFVSRLRLQAEVDAIRGRFHEAISHLRDLERESLTRGDRGQALELAVAAGRLRLAAGDAGAAAEIGDFLARWPITSIDVYSRPYLELARFYAAANEPSRALAWLDRYEREYPAAFRGPDRWLFLRARAEIEAAHSKLADALGTLREAAHAPPIRVGLFDDPGIATANDPEAAWLFERLGERDSSIAASERYLRVHALNRTSVDAVELAPALTRLASMYDAAGNRPRAATYYRRFAMLWRDGDSAQRQQAAAALKRATALDSTISPARSAPSPTAVRRQP